MMIIALLIKLIAVKIRSRNVCFRAFRIGLELYCAERCMLFSDCRILLEA